MFKVPPDINLSYLHKEATKISLLEINHRINTIFLSHENFI